MLILVFAATGLGAWLLAGLWLKRGVSEPPFELVSSQAGIEVRRYGATIVAATEVEGRREEALDEGFRRLAGYIFGKNRSKAKIAMTAPVSAAPSEKIAMTAPVAATELGEGRLRVTFAMPAGYTLETLPEPEDDRVKLEVEPARDLAALRFSGWAGERAVAAHTQELLAWAKQHGHATDGVPVLAQYDPPFTMPLMRRNEILLRLR